MKNMKCMNKTNYQSYSDSEIDTLFNEPWEVADKPYMLHAAFALSELYDMAVSDDDEEEEKNLKNLWGCTLKASMVDRLAADVAADFNDAAANYKTVRIWGKPYAIRKRNAYDQSRLADIFNFPKEGGDCRICPGGIMNLKRKASEADEKGPSAESKENREYMRQIIMLAEDDVRDGWNKLTDMEVAIYCWGLYYAKRESDNLLQFLNEYKKHLCVSKEELMGCFNQKATERGWPCGMYTFSRDKSIAWGKAHGQPSTAIRIPIEDASDYWYNKALKTIFRPIDFLN